jgi:hypothetical protein
MRDLLELSAEVLRLQGPAAASDVLQAAIRRPRPARADATGGP